jgi:putative hemolysin
MSAMLNYILRRDAHRTDAIRAGNLEALITDDQTEIEAAQRLRHRAFSEIFAIDDGGERIDRDVFDPFCDHLIVRTRDDRRVVGTYRIMRPGQAQRIGRYDFENEFDIGALAPVRANLVELGRACVEPGFRGGPVIMLLWSAIGDYLDRNRYTQVIGSVSIPTWDGGHLAASVYRALTAVQPNEPAISVTPRDPLPLSRLCDQLEPVLPPLLKAYLRAGGKVIGEPHWDHRSHSAHLPMLLQTSSSATRYARRFASRLS